MKTREFNSFISILFIACLGFSTYSSKAQVIFVEDTVIKPHTKIKITYNGFPGNPTDWISLARKGQAPETYIQYFFLNSQKTGSLEFDGVTSGNYELRGYFNNETTVRTQTAIRIGNKDLNTLIMTVKPVFKPSDSIGVKFSGFPGNELDYIGIATPGSPANSRLEYKLLNKQQSGSLSFSPRSFGVYELRGFFNNEEIIRATTQLIVGDQNLTLEADKMEYTVTEPIVARFTGFPGNEKDWISISAKGSPAGAYVDFKYLNGQSSGSLAFNPLPEGEYELRGYVNSENVIRVVYPFKVGNGGGPVGNPQTSRIPGTINVQGVLTNSNGQTIQDGAYSITFRFYDLQASGTALWEERLDNLQVASGVFNAVLGITKPFNIPFDKPYFLGIQPGGEPEMKPRIELTAVPYSLMAKTVEDNSISTEKIRPNAVTAEKIAPSIISGINGVTNDGGQVNIVAGANVTILNNDQENTITISASGTGGGGTGTITQLLEGNGIGIQNPLGPNTTIGLKPNILLGPGGSLFLLNQNSVAVAGISANTTNLGGSLSLSNSQGTQTFGVTHFTDGQPLLSLNSRLGRQVVDIKANEFSDGEINLKSMLTNTTVRLGSNDNAGGLVHVFNRAGILASQLGVNVRGDGLLRLNSVNNRLAIEMESGSAGAGIVRLFNEEGTPALRLTTSESLGGRLEVNNRSGNVALRASTNNSGDGGLFIRSGRERPMILMLNNEDTGGGLLGVYNEDGNETIRLSNSIDRQPFIFLKNRLGNVASELIVNEFSDGELTLRSVLRNPALRLTVNEEAGGLINVFNSSGALSAHLMSRGSGSGYFGIFNSDQTEMIQMGILEDKNARITVNNRLATPAVELFSNEFSDGELNLFSVLKNPTLRLTSNDNAGGLLTLFDREGRTAAFLTERAGGIMGFLNTDGTEMILMGTMEDLNGLIRMNNRLGDPVVDIQPNEFSDGQITLGSVVKNRTLLLTANDNAGGLINVFNRSGSISAQLTEMEGDGLFKIFNKDSQLVHQLSIDGENGGLFEIKSKFKFPENVAEMGGNEDDEGHLYLFNRDSKAAVYLSAAGGDGALSLSDIEGRIMASLDGSRYGGSFSLRNSEERPVHYMGSFGKSQEGYYSIYSKTDINKNRLHMGGDTLGNGFLNIYNYNGLNTFFMGHNAFADGTISLKNNMGNLGVLFDALKDGGSVTVTDGKPGTNHRGVLLNGLNGGRLNLFNNQTRLVNVLGVGDNGEGLWQIVNKQDLTKNRIEMGGDNAGAGFAKFFNSNAQKNAEIGTTETMAGYISTYSPSGKRQTYISPGSGEGGAVSIMNNTENTVGTMAYDGYGGTVFMTNKDSKGGAVMTHNTRGGRFYSQNTAGKTIGELSTAADLGGELNIFNSTGINTSKLSHSGNGSGQLEIGTPNGNKVVRVTASDDAGYIGLDNINKLEVVRITANLGQGGGIGIRNPAGADIINLTQDNSYGAILVSNQTGGLLATLTHATNGAGLILNKDHKGGDAVQILGHETGGGNVLTFNNLGKLATSITQNTSSQGKIQVNGSAGNEIARMTGTTAGTGLISIDNSTGINLAGMTNNSVTGGGTVFANNASGKEVVRITSETAGNGTITIDNSAGVKLAGIAKNPANGGLVFANNSTGKEVIRMATSGTGAGYLTMDNSSGATIASITPTLNGGGNISIANSAGSERVKIYTSAAGAGGMSIINSSGRNVIESGPTNENHGSISTYNASGALIAGLLAYPAGYGYVGANNASGNVRAYMSGEENGGIVAVRDKVGSQRVVMNGEGSFTMYDQDGSDFTITSTGSGHQLFLRDKFIHPRAILKGGHLSVQAPNGGDLAVMASNSASNLGFVGVYNANVPGNVVEAGMLVNASGQGVLFADQKNFKMDYPGRPDKQIWYGSLEGPELAAYIRGTGKLINGKASIEFTDHYQKVANTGTMTVILTPLSGKSKGLAVVSKKSTGFEVEELLEGSGTYDFDWEVKCVRQGYEQFEVVRNKADDPQPLRTGQGHPQLMELRGMEKSGLEAAPEKISRQQPNQ